MNSSLILTGAAALAVVIAGCKPASQPPAATPAPPPARVITENDLASIVLTPDAEKRLGISTAPLALESVRRSRLLGGELLLPLGRVSTTTNDTTFAGPSLYSLLPATTPAEWVRVGEMQGDADGRVAAARVELEVAHVALARAQELVDNNAGAQRGLDEARARVQLAEVALTSARERRALLGAPLFEAMRQEVLWLRVSIYAGDLDEISRDAPAMVGSLGKRGREPLRAARPVNVPFSPVAAPATVDLFYELDNADAKRRPGETVAVRLPLQGDEEGPVVPTSAVLHDVHGGTWVYERSAPQTYTRRRVEVRFADRDRAVLGYGPKPGAAIVTAGAAELFGVEFGVGK